MSLMRAVVVENLLTLGGAAQGWDRAALDVLRAAAPTVAAAGPAPLFASLDLAGRLALALRRAARLDAEEAGERKAAELADDGTPEGEAVRDAILADLGQ